MADTTVGLQVSADLLLGGTVQNMDIAKLSKDQLVAHMDAALDARNRAIVQIMGQLSLPTLQRGDLIGQNTASGEWDKATEQTRGRRVRTGGKTAVGFPITKFQRRTGWTRDYLAKATNVELLLLFQDILNGHMETNYKEALRALLVASIYNWSDDLFAEDGSIRVFPLVNGNSDYTPPEFHGTTFSGTHDHYIATNGTFDEADLLSLCTLVREHGYGVDVAAGGQGGQIIVWLHGDQEAAARGHTNFVAANDPKVIDINKIYAASIGADEYFGYNSSAKCYLKVVPQMPTGYVLAFVTSTLNPMGLNRFAPLRRRVPTTAALQGMRRVSERKYPLEEVFYEDFFGFGVANRISAAALFVDAGATYTSPTIS